MNSHFVNFFLVKLFKFEILKSWSPAAHDSEESKKFISSYQIFSILKIFLPGSTIHALLIFCYWSFEVFAYTVPCAMDSESLLKTVPGAVTLRCR